MSWLPGTASNQPFDTSCPSIQMRLPRPKSLVVFFVSKLLMYSHLFGAIISLLKSCVEVCSSGSWGSMAEAGTVLRCDLHLPDSTAGSTDPGLHGVYTRLILWTLQRVQTRIVHVYERRHAGNGISLPMCQPSTRKLSVISRYCFVCAKCTVAAKRWMAVRCDSAWSAEWGKSFCLSSAPACHCGRGQFWIDVGRVYYALFTSTQRSWKNAFRAE